MNLSATNTFRESRRGKYVMSFIVAWTLLLLNISNKIGGDNVIYAIGEIHTYDSSVFNNNIYMGEGVISPRYVIDIVFSLIMKVNGGCWAAAALLWTYFGAVVQSIAIANISNRISQKYQIICSALFTCFISSFGISNNLAGFTPIAVMSISIAPALAFSYLAISFVIGDEKKYNLAWIFAGCAAVCHIHEGIYCCVVIFIIAAVDCMVKKRILIKENICILIAIAALALVVLPNMFTDKIDITNKEFVRIYSIFRHPHHLVPLSWEYDEIIRSGWINIFVFLLSLEAVIYLKKEEIKKYFLEALLFMLTWVAALAGTYLFTSKIPIAFVSTMFLTKFFKYVVIISLIMFLKMFIEVRDRKWYFSGYLMLLFIFMMSALDLNQIAILFIITAIAMAAEQTIDTKKIFSNDRMILLFDILSFIFLVSLKIRGRRTMITMFCVFFAIAFTYFVSIKSKKLASRLSIAACICMVALSFYGRIVYANNGSLDIINGEKALINSMGSDAYELALKFRKLTDENDEFIANPSDDALSGWFQVVSERNCYVVFKVIPSSKCTVDDWYKRYMQVAGILNKKLSDIEQIMKDNGIQYLLVDKAYYDKFDAASEFTVFTTSTQDSVRVYKLN